METAYRAPRLISLAMGALLASGAVAESIAQATTPSPGARDLLAGPVEAWAVQLDRPGGGDPLRLREDRPGVRARSGAAGIAYRPDAQVDGFYRVEIALTQFDPGGRNEGYGLFIGGADLDSPDRSYVYFLIRQDGQTLVKLRNGTKTPVLRDWTPAPAFSTWEERSPDDNSIRNAMTIEVGPAGLTWTVNGHIVFEAGPDQVETEGGLGVRVNHGLDLRMDEFRVVRGG